MLVGKFSPPPSVYCAAGKKEAMEGDCAEVLHSHTKSSWFLFSLWGGGGGGSAGISLIRNRNEISFFDFSRRQDTCARTNNFFGDSDIFFLIFLFFELALNLIGFV